MSENKQFDIKKIGEKGAFLADMAEAGVLVPSGFIIVNAYNEFIKTKELQAKIETIMDFYNFSASDPVSMMRISQEIIDLINKTKFTKNLEKKLLDEFDKLKTEGVAVRHSLLVSEARDILFNREFTVQPNIKRENFTDAVKKAWTAYFSAPAMLYRLNKHDEIDKPYSVLLVQKMINTDVSGICLSINPLIGNDKQMLIQANYGLSDEYNADRITRDNYIVNKNNLKIINRTIYPQLNMLSYSKKGGLEKVLVGKEIQNKQKFDDKQIINLSKIVKHIEKFYGGIPQKVEWGLEKDKLYVFQTQAMSKK